MSINDFWINQRNAWKREAAKRQIEWALNQGKTVLQITPNSRVKMRRKGHLTMMEDWKPESKSKISVISIDEWGLKTDDL